MRIKNSFFIIPTVFLFICLLYFSQAAAQIKGNSYNNILVVKVFDGDTILLENGEKIRLIGIDCPEDYENDKLIRDVKRTGQDSISIIEMGKKACDFTRNLVMGKKVRLEFDAEKRDKYKRLLAYAYLQDGTFVNAKIIEQGYAQPMTIPPNVKYAGLFQRFYREAQQNKRGLWER